MVSCVTSPPCMMCTALRIGASGLRSSWASIARNSFLRRSASWTAVYSRAFSIAIDALLTTSLASARRDESIRSGAPARTTAPRARFPAISGQMADTRSPSRQSSN